ncbi:MAG: hypothetical protein NVSMB3_13100 [Acidobacteriaceae bacterium]
MTNPSRYAESAISPAASGSEMENPGAARASLVNRTHRIVRERARSQSARRSRVKSLWIPLAVCSALLLIISTGVWTILVQNDLSPSAIPDASEQMLVFLVWFLPVSAALLAMVWFKRTRVTSNSESIR